MNITANDIVIGVVVLVILGFVVFGLEKKFGEDNTQIAIAIIFGTLLLFVIGYVVYLSLK